MNDEVDDDKVVEGEIEPGGEEYQRLHAARDHLLAAASELKQFVDEDVSRLAKDTVDKLDDTVTGGITKTADAMIEALEALKQRLQR